MQGCVGTAIYLYDAIVGRHEATGEAHLVGSSHTDGLGQHRGEAPPWHHTHSSVRIAELGVLARHEEVTIQRQLHSSPHSNSVYCTDHRLGEGRKRAPLNLTYHRLLDSGRSSQVPSGSGKLYYKSIHLKPSCSIPSSTRHFVLL
jgi:hypothetical protein